MTARQEWVRKLKHRRYRAAWCLATGQTAGAGSSEASKCRFGFVLQRYCDTPKIPEPADSSIDRMLSLGLKSLLKTCFHQQQRFLLILRKLGSG